MRDQELELALRPMEEIEPAESLAWLLWSWPDPGRGTAVRKIECPGSPGVQEARLSRPS